MPQNNCGWNASLQYPSTHLIRSEDIPQTKTPKRSDHLDRKQFSIGPQILFILSSKKTEGYAAHTRTKLQSKGQLALAKLLWIYMEECANSEAPTNLVKDYLSHLSTTRVRPVTKWFP